MGRIGCASETPILDLEDDPPPPNLYFAQAYVVLGLWVVALWWITIDPWGWFPVLYLSILVHEIGHAVAAKIVGFRLNELAVGGISLVRLGGRWQSDGPWRLRFQARKILFGGKAHVLLESTDIDSARYVGMIAAGPLATVLLAGAAGLLLRNSSHPPLWLRSFWWINLFLLFPAVMPSNGLNHSDYFVIWQWLRDREALKSRGAALQVEFQESVGVRPRHWNPIWVARLARASPESGDDPYLQMLAYLHRADLGHRAFALQHLERALAASENCSPYVRNRCFLEASYASALLCQSPRAARVWLDRIPKVRDPFTRNWIDAAIAYSELRYVDALQLWNEALIAFTEKKLHSGLERGRKAQIVMHRSLCRVLLSGFPSR